MNFRIERFFLQISRPLCLLNGMLVYALGVGISRYLGNPVDWGLVVIGQFWVLSYQLGSHYLIAYFNLPQISGNFNKIQIPLDDNQDKLSIRRDLLLLASLTAFAAMATLTFIMIRTNNPSGPGLIIIGFLLLSSISYAVPPFRLVTSGYGELLQSINMANLIPALAFILQNGELHRLVAMSTFPLTALHLAMLLAVNLPNYARDLRKGQATLLVRLGWERGMNLHNLLILCAFLLFGVAMLFGLSISVALPVFFVLPLGLFQIWHMIRIASGVKPNWPALNLTAILTFGLTTYLLAFSFWIR